MVAGEDIGMSRSVHIIHGMRWWSKRRVWPIVMKRMAATALVLFASVLISTTASADYVQCVNNCVNWFENCQAGAIYCMDNGFSCIFSCTPDPPPNGPSPGNGPQGCGGPSSPGSSGTGSSVKVGDPVDPGSGLFTYDHTDLELSDVVPIRLTRSYRELDTTSYIFGVGTIDNYDLQVIVDSAGSYTYADLILPDAGRVHYVRTSSGTSFVDAVFTDNSTPDGYFGSTIAWSGSGWTLTLKDKTQMTFGYASMLSSITDRNGNTVQVQRGSGHNISQIVSPNGRWISFTYDSNGRVDRAQDNTGRTVWYVYDSSGHLVKFLDANGGTTSYAYDSAGRMASITTPNGNTVITNQYDANNRVVQQTQADSTTFGFNYTLDGSGNVTETDMTDPRGAVCRMVFGTNGYLTADTWAVGKPEQEGLTYNRDPNSNLLDSSTDALGRTTAYTYDSLGNTTSVTRLSGTSQAATTSFTYDSVFNQLTTVTDPLGHTWSFSLDGNGNIVAATDPLGHANTMTYNSHGQVASTSDTLGDTTTFGYTAGMLSSITDALGHTTTLANDGAGRNVESTDPLGNSTFYDYDLLDDVSEVADPNGAGTAFNYDPDRNLTSVTDANGNMTTYAYDSMDRRINRTDALGATESYSNDGNGNLIQHVDRRGKVTVYQYDALNRRTFAGFGQNGGTYESSISYAYDAGDRLTETIDSIAGTIARTYDDLDHLTAEQTPQGEVSYSYDGAGRRTAMTVVGQGTVGYTWDNASRLLQITQGSNTVGFVYDNANRRTSLALPNGVTVAYTYDSNSRVTRLTYTSNGSQLGNLTYAYDAAGRVIDKGGSLAATGLPASVSGNTFNADNAMTGFNGTRLSYDANGNLTGDGTNTYVWDARNHMSAISGGTTAGFVYDAIGRRAAKNIDGSVTQLLYDGPNPVQELDGASPPNVTANLLTGLGIDEYFSRADASGAMSFLTDTLGSAVALTDSSGSVNTDYTYEPFGNVTMTGSNSNPYQFTGRENDGTGLYSYRNRYYSSTLQRFISQDPVDFAAGSSNLYGYVSDNPTNLTDPDGEGFLDCGKQIARLVTAFDYFWKRYQEHQCKNNCQTDTYKHHQSLEEAANGLMNQARTTQRACKSPIVDAITTLLSAARDQSVCDDLLLIP